MSHRKRVFENINYVNCLSSNRNLSQESIVNISKIVNDLRLSVGNTKCNIVDICCGAGRFSIPFSQHISNINLYCIDSSENMLQSLDNKKREFEIDNITTIHKDFNIWETDKKFQIVFMSAAIHLFESKINVFRRISSLQNSGDYFVLRTPFKEQLEKSEVYKHVPEALNIYKSTHPSLEELKELSKKVGYIIIKIQNFIEINIWSRKDFLDLYYKKEHAAFWEIPDDILSKRIEEIESFTKGLKEINCHMETSLVTFQKN